VRDYQVAEIPCVKYCIYEGIGRKQKSSREIEAAMINESKDGEKSRNTKNRKYRLVKGQWQASRHRTEEEEFFS